MITDHLNVFTDNAAVTATANSNVVQLMPFLGRGGAPAKIAVVVTQGYAPAATLTVGVQESDKANADFATLATYTFPGIQAAGAALFIELPGKLKKPFARLAYTVTGTTTTGKLFAGVARDTCEPYEAGMYVDGAKVR